jgi:hypothetical protein
MFAERKISKAREMAVNCQASATGQIGRAQGVTEIP